MEDRERVVEPPLVSSAAVNERTLLILAAVGASVVAYAVYALMTRGVVEEQPAPVRAAATGSESDEEHPRRSAKRSRKRGPRVNAEVPTGRSTPTPGGPPPPLPKPKVSVDEAREDYDDFMRELERELQRNKDTGKALANEHWVEYYRRGHEIMDPLRMHLSSGTEEDKRAVGEMDEDLRNLMAKLQTDPADLDENE